VRRPALAVLVLALVGSALVAPAAQAEPTWIAGPLEETNILSCIQNIPEQGTGAYLAYLEPEVDTPPQTGEVYYVAVVVAGLGNPCAGTIYNPQLRLPPGTEAAVSAANPVYCFASPASGQPVQLVSGMCAGVEQLSNGDLQIDSSAAWAGSFEGTQIAPFFPIAQGYFEEEHVPVVSNSALSGAEKLESDIYTTDDGGRHLHPWLAPVVTAAPAGLEESGAGEVPGAGGGSGGGEVPRGGSSGGTSSTPAPAPAPAPAASAPAPAPAASSTPKHKARRCKKGRRRKLVKGRSRCVKRTKHRRRAPKPGHR